MSNLISQEEIGQEKAILTLGDTLSGGSEAMAFQNRLSELVKDSISLIEIDLGNVETINSSGLGMIVASHSNMKRDKAKLVLKNIPPKVDELLKMTHLDKVLNIES